MLLEDLVLEALVFVENVDDDALEEMVEELVRVTELEEE